MLLKMVFGIGEVLWRLERVLLVLEEVFRLHALLLMDEVIRRPSRGGSFVITGKIFIPFAVSMPAPQDRPDNNQNNKKNEHEPQRQPR